MSSSASSPPPFDFPSSPSLLSPNELIASLLPPSHPSSISYPSPFYPIHRTSSISLFHSLSSSSSPSPSLLPLLAHFCSSTHFLSYLIHQNPYGQNYFHSSINNRNNEIISSSITFLLEMAEGKGMGILKNILYQRDNAGKYPFHYVENKETFCILYPIYCYLQYRDNNNNNNNNNSPSPPVDSFSVNISLPITHHTLLYILTKKQNTETISFLMQQFSPHRQYSKYNDINHNNHNIDDGKFPISPSISSSLPPFPFPIDIIDIFLLNQHGQSPYHVAVEYGYNDIVRIMTEFVMDQKNYKGGEYESDKLMLMYSGKNPHLKMIIPQFNTLLSTHISHLPSLASLPSPSIELLLLPPLPLLPLPFVSILYLLSHSDHIGFTPFHYASIGAWPEHESHTSLLLYFRDIILSKELISLASSSLSSLSSFLPLFFLRSLTTIRDSQGLSPLHISTDVSALRTLILMGGDMNGRDKAGRSVLHLCGHENAIMMGEWKYEVGKYYPQREGKERGNDIYNMEDENHDDHLDLDWLLPPPSPLHCTPVDHSGRSPLHLVVEEDKIFLLLRMGNNINMQDKYDFTPLDCAIMTERIDLVDVIRSRGGKTKKQLDEERKVKWKKVRFWSTVGESAWVGFCVWKWGADGKEWMDKWRGISTENCNEIGENGKKNKSKAKKGVLKMKFSLQTVENFKVKVSIDALHKYKEKKVAA